MCLQMSARCMHGRNTHHDRHLTRNMHTWGTGDALSADASTVGDAGVRIIACDSPEGTTGNVSGSLAGAVADASAGVCAVDGGAAGDDDDSPSAGAETGVGANSASVG